MGVSIACGLLVVVALVLVARWRGLDLTPPPEPADPGRRARFRRYLWWVELVLITTLLTGVLVVGAGGRLAMRLLGATAGDRAQRQLTEANEVVGEVTVGGTIGFVIFAGLTTAFVTTVLYLLLRRFLPPRWLGGLAFGAGLLVVLGTRNEPLRPDNTDFDILGPWWLSIVVFTVLALVHGVALAAVTAGVSRWLPLPGRSRRSAVYLLLGVPVLVAPVGLAMTVVGLVYVFAGGVIDRVRRWLVGPAGTRAGRVGIAAAVLVAAPGFVVAIGDLVGRGP